MNIKPDFTQTIHRQWHFWGMQFDFTFPGPAKDILEMPPSVSQAPGQEPLGFYETAFDFEANQSYSVGSIPIIGEEQLSPEQIDLLKNAKAHFSRRRFNHSWFVNYAGRHESFWCDIWVHRVEQDNNLLDPNNLQTAHVNYLSKCWMTDAEDEDDLFAPETEPEWHALNWRWQKVNNYWLQTYDEVKGKSLKDSYLYGKNILLPLSPKHYLCLRFYRLSASNYKEAVADFEQLVEFIIQHFSFRLSPDVEKALQTSAQVSVSAIDFSPPLSASAFKAWSRLDKALKEKTYQSSAIEETPAPLEEEEKEESDWAIIFNYYFIVVIWALGIIFVVTMIKGSLFINSWHEENPGSAWYWLNWVYLISLLIWLPRNAIREWLKSETK